MQIRSATKEDINQIADLHIKAFEGFFLTMLGKKFLFLMYESFALQNSGILRVLTKDDNNIIGFAAGAYDPGTYFSSLRKSKWFLFVLAAIPSIIKNPVKVIQKLYYAIFYKGDAPSELKSAALLSSIAVLPSMTGKSIGKKLLADFEAQVLLADLKNLYLTTDKLDNDAAIHFYLKAGYYVESEFCQSDGRQMLRLIKIL